MATSTARKQGNMIVIREPAKVTKSGSSRALANLRRETADRLSKVRARAAAVARQDSDILTTWGAGAGLALAERYLPDVVSKLQLGPLPPATALALGLWWAARKGIASRYTRPLAAGMGAIATYSLVKEQVSGVGSAARFPEPEVIAYVAG